MQVMTDKGEENKTEDAKKIKRSIKTMKVESNNMKIFINGIRNQIIFTENNARNYCMTFHDKYISLIENGSAKEIVQVDIELDENGTVDIGPELKKIFEMRGLLNRAITCVGPYDIFGKKGYMMHIEGCEVTNPALEGALLEKLNWEKNQEN